MPARFLQLQSSRLLPFLTLYGLIFRRERAKESQGLLGAIHSVYLDFEPPLSLAGSRIDPECQIHPGSLMLCFRHNQPPPHCGLTPPPRNTAPSSHFYTMFCSPGRCLTEIQGGRHFLSHSLSLSFSLSRSPYL